MATDPSAAPAPAEATTTPYPAVVIPPAASPPVEPPAEDTPEDRLKRIESALAAKLGLNLSEFDGVDILAARASKLAQAAEVAVSAVHEAFTEPELTVAQRVERIEKALHSGGTLA